MKKLLIPIICAVILAGCGAAAPDVTASVEDPIATLVCNPGFSEYQVEGTNIQLCHDPAWGDVVVRDIDTLEGTLAWVSFSDLPGGPEIWYESTDFVPLDGDSDFFNFSDIRITASADMLKDQLIDELDYPFAADDFKLRKSDAGGKKAIRVHVDTYDDFRGDVDSVRYYIPNAFEGHNVTISGDQKYAIEVDDMAWSILF